MSKTFNELQAKKELLILKAELERMELSHHVSSTRQMVNQQLGWMPAIKKLVSLGGHTSLNGLGPLAPFAKQSLAKVASEKPYLGMLASLALIRWGFPAKQVAVRAALASGALAAAVFWFRGAVQKSSPPTELPPRQ